MKIDESLLLSIPPKEYGPEYKSHLLDQYKLYVEMADRISSRRQSANNFFLSVNTVLIAFLGFVAGGKPIPTFPWLLVVAIAGSVLCFYWYRLVRSYKDINSGKFDVIHAIESKLPLAPYDAEWVRLGQGEDPKLYLPFTHIEVRIPWIFAALYVSLAVFNLISFM